MLRNYLAVTLRNLLRQKLHTFINVFGLALGLACCLLMALFVKHEWSHDRFHARRDRIYRVVAREAQPDGNVRYEVLQSREIPQAFKDEYPGVELASGFVRSEGRVAAGDRTFWERLGLVDPDFLSMFSFPLVTGDPSTALDRPDGLVLTESVVQKLFDARGPDYSDVIGQSVTFPGKGITCEVTGVTPDVSPVSSLQFDLLMSMEHRNYFGQSNAGGGVYQSVYLCLAKGQKAEEIEAASVSFAGRHLGPRIEDRRKWNAIGDSEDAFSLQLQPLTDVYWNERINNYYESHGSREGVTILGGIAAIVLLLACSNFTTLSIAGSTTRAMEVGVRKALGANRRQVMRQFWGEALLMSFGALLIAVLLAELLLPVFNGLVDRNLQIAYLGDRSFLPFLVGIVLATGLIAGGYPALMLARFQPVTAMKGEGRIGGRSRLTRVLVVLQYGASIALMICTGVMIKQQGYLSSKYLGYDQEHVVVVPTQGLNTATRFKEELLKDPQVLGVALTDRAFTTGSSSTGYYLPDGTQRYVRLIRAGVDFLPMLKIDLVAGRNFSEDHPSDQSEAVIINETLARELGLDDSVGQPLAGFEWRTLKNPTIIGVVRDFHIDSLHRRIQPLVLQMKHFQYWPRAMIRLAPGQLGEAAARVEETWKAVAPANEPFQMSFLDANLDDQYRSEKQWQKVLMIASSLAIVISCLGLLGLAILAVSRRTKEVGIRTTLGAGVANLVALLSRDFAQLLVVASLLAWPVAYLVMDEWLAAFSYRIGLGLGIFLLAGLPAVVLALVTVGTQTVRAALTNPVDALRYE